MSFDCWFHSSIFFSCLFTKKVFVPSQRNIRRERERERERERGGWMRGELTAYSSFGLRVRLNITYFC